MLDAGEPGSSDADHSMSLWHTRRDFLMSPTPPVAGASRLASSSEVTDGFAVVGIQDESGMLVYAELETALSLAQQPESEADAGAAGIAAPAGRGHALLVLLEGMGCSQRMLLSASLELALGGDTDLLGQATHPPSDAYAVHLTRVEAPGGRRIFETTPVVPLSTWYPLQQHRVRYFKKKKKPEDAGD